jgi:hypothetical protein
MEVIFGACRNMDGYVKVYNERNNFLILTGRFVNEPTASRDTKGSMFAFLVV